MITVEKLISVVHRHTDPIRITVVMGNAWSNYPLIKNKGRKKMI